MAAKKPKIGLILRLDEDLVKRIKDFRFDHRFEDRQAAMVWLLEFALKRLPKGKPLPKL